MYSDRLSYFSDSDRGFINAESRSGLFSGYKSGCGFSQTNLNKSKGRIYSIASILYVVLDLYEKPLVFKEVSQMFNFFSFPNSGHFGSDTK